MCRMEENVPWHHEVRAFAQAIADRTEGAPGRKGGAGRREGERERGREGERERGRSRGWIFPVVVRVAQTCAGAFRPTVFVLLLISPPTSLPPSLPLPLPPSLPPFLLSSFLWIQANTNSWRSTLIPAARFWRGKRRSTGGGNGTLGSTMRNSTI
jgi:hypothetical protein